MDSKKENKNSCWIPGSIQDLEDHLHSMELILASQIQLDVKDPGFNDPAYHQRRKQLAEIAANYQSGQKIPQVDYTVEETATWSAVYRRLTKLYQNHACLEYNKGFQMIRGACLFSENSIPKLQDLSDLLQERTGFTLRPTTGMLPWREFFSALAFQVFPVAMHMRHSSDPMKALDPLDICHELLGHVPLLADPGYAKLCHEIGIASIGLPEDSIEHLSKCFMVTIEGGICRQNGALKAYGGILLTSCGQLEYCLSSKPEKKLFDFNDSNIKSFASTAESQTAYYVTESFQNAIGQLNKYYRKNQYS